MVYNVIHFLGQPNCFTPILNSKLNIISVASKGYAWRLWPVFFINLDMCLICRETDNKV